MFRVDTGHVRLVAVSSSYRYPKQQAYTNQLKYPYSMDFRNFDIQTERIQTIECLKYQWKIDTFI